MENTTGVYGTWEPKCKIRFSTAEIDPDMDYIAVPAHELVELLRDQMKLSALESGGVDNWSAYGWAMSDYMEELPSCYDAEKLSMWAAMEKPNDMTIEEYIDEMSIEDYARFEVDVM
jgi:hypothetical protein